LIYANKTEYRQVNYFSKLKVKIGKKIANSFPLNSIRIFGLKLCGFTVGDKVYIGEDLIVASIISEESCNLIIGDRVAIGPRVTLILSSDANWSRLMEKIKPIKSTVILQDDCWIGAGVIIMPGITIGKSAIVGSGAVVTKNVPDNEVVVGIPAKKNK
jgi:maltose O-acetyltransferase